MTYKEALKAARKAGGKISDDPSKAELSLAQACSLVPAIHPGINPEKLYDGAIKQGVSAQLIFKKISDGMFMNDLMFVGMGI